MNPPKCARLEIPDRPTAELIALAGQLFELETISVESGAIRVEFTKVRDPDQVLDQACEREAAGQVGQRVPYWAAVWESARGVVGEMHQQGWLRPGGRVLDLGCGMGLTGLLLGEAGMDVSMVDHEEQALMVARVNASRLKSPARVGLCDWQTDDLGERFQTIVGSDVLYDWEQWKFLDAFWNRHLARGGYVILGEPMRPKADVFARWASSHDWRVWVFPGQRVEGKPIRIFRLER